MKGLCLWMGYLMLLVNKNGGGVFVFDSKNNLILVFIWIIKWIFCLYIYKDGYLRE